MRACDDEWADDLPAELPALVVYPSDDEPEVALYGPDGEPLRWYARRPIGFRSLRDEAR